jgi:hypothetical protein
MYGPIYHIPWLEKISTLFFHHTSLSSFYFSGFACSQRQLVVIGKTFPKTVQRRPSSSASISPLLIIVSLVWLLHKTKHFFFLPDTHSTQDKNQWTPLRTAGPLSFRIVVCHTKEEKDGGTL